MKDVGYGPVPRNNFKGLYCPSRENDPAWTWYKLMWRVYGRFSPANPQDALAWPDGNMGSIFIRKLSNPSKSIIYGDAGRLTDELKYNYCCFLEKIYSGADTYIYLNHSGRANISLADGHVEAAAEERLPEFEVKAAYGQNGNLLNFQ
jgi:prepilin-type processing-associated H-X9-DG protein